MLYSMSMNAIVREQLPRLVALAKRYGVSRLDLIGSATREDFDPQRSDLDFVVEFDSLTTDNAADRYFGLFNDLEDLFGRPIDLVSYKAIRNPFFKSVVERTRSPLYAA